MKTIQRISNQDLLQITKRLVEEERLKTLEVIEHIQEIYQRRIHLSLGYSSLHEFLVKELSYSDGAAHRRISAMRLVADVPEVKVAIALGVLSLSNAGIIQGFFKSECEKHKKTYSKEEKLELLRRVESTTQEECKRELALVSPTYEAHVNEIKVEEDAELIAMMDEFRQLAMLAEGSAKSIFKAALKTAIGSLKAKRASRETLQERVTMSQNKLNVPKSSSRYIPIQIKRSVWRRDLGRCTFLNPSFKLLREARCNAQHNLHYDHIMPFALGGETSVENLRLVCRAHNMHLAVETFGAKKIEHSKTRL